MIDSKRYVPYRIPEQVFREANDARKFVRAFIANTSMPKSVREVLEEGLEENYFESNRFDIESILQGDRESDWTVPKWAKPGDIIMFMLAKTSDYAVKCLNREYAETKDEFELYQQNVIEPMLLKAHWLAEKFAGKIMAIGRVSSLPYKAKPGIESAHYKSPIFADISDITLLERPVDIAEFSHFQQIARGVTITPVLGRSFEKLRSVLGTENELPQYVVSAIPVPDFCQDINRNNWMTLADEHRRSFMLEEEFRSCYLDFLLDDLSEGNVWRECRFTKKAGFGVADYVIELGGKYLTVEAKLNAQSERNLPKQLRKYCHVQKIALTRDSKISGRKSHNDNVLVFDTEAAYLYRDSDGGYLQQLFSLGDCDKLGQAGMREVVLAAIKERDSKQNACSIPFSSSSPKNGTASANPQLESTPPAGALIS